MEKQIDFDQFANTIRAEQRKTRTELVTALYDLEREAYFQRQNLQDGANEANLILLTARVAEVQRLSAEAAILNGSVRMLTGQKPFRIYPPTEFPEHSTTTIREINERMLEL